MNRIGRHRGQKNFGSSTFVSERISSEPKRFHTISIISKNANPALSRFLCLLCLPYMKFECIFALTYLFEEILRSSADRTDPATGNFFKRGPWLNTRIGVPGLGIIDISANRAPIFSHSFALIIFY